MATLAPLETLFLVFKQNCVIYTRKLVLNSLLAIAFNFHPLENASGFQVVGNKIYDPDGAEFIIKGTNINGPKFGWPGNTAGYVNLVVDCWKFNAVRVNVNLFDGKIPYPENGAIESIIDTYTRRGIVTIIAAHDRTGSYYEGNELEALKTYYYRLARKYKNNPYVWFNVMNEPGGEDSSQRIDTWLKIHQIVIEIIRDRAGANNIIVIDGHYWGQDAKDWNANPVSDRESAILGDSDRLIRFNDKTYQNLVFSVHLYDRWDFGGEKMANYFDRVLAKNIALIIGEYGAEKEGKFQSTVEAMFEQAIPRKIGRIVWSWWGGDRFDLTTTDNGGAQHINDCNNPTNLTWLGQQVWRDNRSFDEKFNGINY